uniref:Transposase n=1 Tax=Plectus sambesii TaxID=2011161 RepID=A0A914X6C5_9BILA
MTAFRQPSLLAENGSSHARRPLSVMVWAGVTADDKTSLIFIDQGVKMNQEVYREEVLEKVLPWARDHFTNRRWTFQQDSAPSHRAKTMQQWCENNFSAFIKSTVAAVLAPP